MVRLKPYPLHEELVQALRKLYEWGAATGGWEDPVWREARQILKRADNPGTAYRCPECGSPKLRAAVWADPNTGVVQGDRPAEGYVCAECGSEGEYVGGRRSLRPSRDERR